jgi:hypothetical protein
MSTTAPTIKISKKNNKLAGMPDERFWIKYSQNHELPLSITSSLFIHAVAIGVVGLILAGFLAGMFTQKRPPEVQAFAMGGGGGDPNGSVESPGEAAVPAGREAVKQDRTAPAPVVENKEPLKVPTTNEVPLVASTEVTGRWEESKALSSTSLKDVIKEANAKAARAASRAQGRGGDGSGGGAGNGEGPGVGDKVGAGSGGSIQESRKARWTLLFTTSSPEDYLRQLRDLGAIIAVPESSGSFLVFRDLNVRPLVGRIETGGELPKIQYSDDDPRTIQGFVKLLGLRSVPPYFMAFFDPKLEEELRSLEKRAYSGDESRIVQTTFQFERQPNGKYKPRVREVKTSR